MLDSVCAVHRDTIVEEVNLGAEELFSSSLQSLLSLGLAKRL